MVANVDAPTLVGVQGRPITLQTSAARVERHPHMPSAPATKTPQRSCDQAITFANGAVGETNEIPSASPVNYHQVIAAPGEMPTLTVVGKLFLPPAAKRTTKGKLPLVIVVPGE